MDNELNDKLEQFLSRPDSMEKIQAMMASLGGAVKSDDTPDPAPESSGGGFADLAALQNILPLMQGLGGNDKDPGVALLRALRPYLHDGREKRVDEAISMLRLAKILPLLQTKL